MSDSADISALALYAYYLGRSPITWAEQQTDTLIRVHLEVADSRAENPTSFPGYCIDLTTDALARRIIGELLDAGWTPPDLAEVLCGYEPPALPDEAGRRALAEAHAALDELPDCGAEAVDLARAELGSAASALELTLRAAEIAKKGRK